MLLASVAMVTAALVTYYRRKRRGDARRKLSDYLAPRTKRLSSAILLPIGFKEPLRRLLVGETAPGTYDVIVSTNPTGTLLTDEDFNNLPFTTDNRTIWEAKLLISDRQDLATQAAVAKAH